MLPESLRCERKVCSSKDGIAVEFIERTECPHCNFREVIRVCEPCLQVLKRIVNPAIRGANAFANCPKCQKPKDLDTSFRFLGKV